MKAIFDAPHPFMKPKALYYPDVDIKKEENGKANIQKLTAPDFGVSLEQSIKAKSFREYDNEIKYRLITNDGTDQSLIWLTMARNIFHQELSQMPENYISKLVFNQNHYTVVLILEGMVFGGICFRPFFDRDFAEIAFCAVSSKSQIRGFGAHLMAKVKTVLQVMSLHNILTYADNSAVGYFQHQGFTREINLRREVWRHCIKDYQGATLIHCKIVPFVDYLRINDIVDNQLKIASSLLNYCQKRIVRFWPITRIAGLNVSGPPVINIYDQMRLDVRMVKQHSRSWPFRKPVTKSEAPNYSEIIKFPMDLMTLEKNVYEGKYLTFEKFVSDLRLIFSNCYQYNKADSIYSKSAKQLEAYVNKLLASQQVRTYG